MGQASHSSGNVGHMIINATIFATNEAMEKIANKVGLVPEVLAPQWQSFMVQEHEDLVLTQLECQSIAVEEKWQLAVFDMGKPSCYLGMMTNTDPLLDSEPLNFDGLDVSMDLSANSEELGNVIDSAFVTRESNIYSPFPYIM